MTHGFDDIGREYDGNGNRNGWWTPQVPRVWCVEGRESLLPVYQVSFACYEVSFA